MPINNTCIFGKDRIGFSKNLSKKEIKKLAKNKDLKCLQFQNPVKTKTFKLLNDELFPKRPDVELRAYGFYSQVCDLSLLSEMTNLRHFSADYIWDAVGLENVCKMEMLENLEIGIYHLEDFCFLNEVNPNIKRLSLYATKSKKPSLTNLSRFKFLEEIYLEGQQKDIDVLSELLALQRVILRSISTPRLEYLKPLKNMWSLDVKLGGVKDFSAIEGMKNIKYLELWRIRGLSDLSFISTLEGLQCLFLQSLKQVKSLPSFEKLSKLKRVCLETMKGLQDISSLNTAPALSEFKHVDASNMQPKDYLPLLSHPNLKQAVVGFGSYKRNNRFLDLLKEHGIQEYKHQPFQFS